MQISMSHMNSRTGWYLILRKTITVLLVQQNSAKWSLLPFRTDLKTTFILTTHDRRGVKNPSFCNCWSFQTLQSSHSNIQACSAASGKDQGPTPAVRLCNALFIFNFFCPLTKWPSQGQDSPQNTRGYLPALTAAERRPKHSSLLSQKPTEHFALDPLN